MATTIEKAALYPEIVYGGRSRWAAAKPSG